jgi:RNA polymerase sigma-70 factor (ECF subfamily)
VQNIHTAEDLTEDVFFELMKKRPRFSGKSTFKTWLYAIGRNLTAKYIRSHSMLQVVPLESQEYLADEEKIECSLIHNEQKRIVHLALHSLKPEYRQVLYLNYFEGFSNMETAQIMHKSDKQIRDLIYHAKKALKAELEGRGFAYEE